MLDVHAPHGSVHGWRDFLVHIAAIAIGLLLALGLEKFAEYVHERRQLTAARHELAAEMAENRTAWSRNMQEASRIQQELAADLKVIQAVRSHGGLEGGKLDYSVHFYAARDGSWLAARQGASLDLMPHSELEGYSWFHAILASVMESMHTLETTLQIGGAIAASAPPERLSARDLDELGSRTLEAQGRLEHLRMFLGFEQEGLSTLSGKPGPVR